MGVRTALFLKSPSVVNLHVGGRQTPDLTHRPGGAAIKLAERCTYCVKEALHLTVV
jgi:hypothetical protein